MRLYKFMNGHVIDLDQMQQVGVEYGDSSARRYEVYFKDGGNLTVYVKPFRGDQSNVTIWGDRDYLISSWEGRE